MRMLIVVLFHLKISCMAVEACLLCFYAHPVNLNVKLDHPASSIYKPEVHVLIVLDNYLLVTYIIKPIQHCRRSRVLPSLMSIVHSFFFNGHHTVSHISSMASVSTAKQVFWLEFSELSWEYTTRGINLLYFLHFLYDFITRASFISSQQEASCAGFAWLKIFHGHRVSFFHARSGNRITFAAIFTHFTVKRITPVINCCCFVKNILIHWFSTISASAK